MPHIQTSPASAAIPLAERLRPRTLQEVIGQAHLLAPGMPLQRALVTGRLHSMVLWGPPGVGKTTLGRLAAEAFGCEFIALSAVMGKLQDIREALAQAERHHTQRLRTLLFVDEIHRFTRKLQDELLPAVLAGHIAVMGATTENPSFTMSRRLLSRMQVYVLKPLQDADLLALLQRAQKTLGEPMLTADAAQSLLAYADGDARRLLNLIEHCHAAAQAAGASEIGADFTHNAATPATRRFDKGGENFYDQISALHKSVRGSHPDAALYWLCRMLDGGTDLRYLARRIIAMAWDDIGLADPQAMHIANAAAECCEHDGRPNGELALAQAVLYLAAAAKSNAGTMAYSNARAHATEDTSPVPLRLSKGSNAKLGWEDCLPDGMEDPEWYQPVPRGLEINIAQKMALLRRGKNS